MKLLHQPEDGVTPLLSGINGAESSIEIVIFRFDQPEIERALANAAGRGVSVRALIAHVNGSGEDGLRRLETRLLAEGVTVARTGDAFARYHAKFMIVDRTELYLLAFNFTKLDISRSRSFGVVAKDPKLVREALKLMEADTRRHPYEPGLSTFVISPDNARKELSSFIRAAQKELLIYDPKVSDRAMVHLLGERCKAGVDIRIIGSAPPGSGLAARKLISPRLHTRAIVRDGEAAFIGSQSLREMELDQRREAGLVFSDAAIVNQIAKTFQEDWSVSKAAEQDEGKSSTPPAARLAKKIAKAVAKELPPVTPVLEVTIRELGVEQAGLTLEPEALEETVRDAVKDAVKEVLEDAVEHAKRD